MSAAQFINDLYLPDLGIGTGFALWGFRACASGKSRCQAVSQGYERAFGHDAPGALADMLSLVRCLGRAGRRKISIAPPGCARMTADEVSIAAMLSAAQRRHDEERDAHATWLLAQAPVTDTLSLVDRIADLFSVYDMTLTAPLSEFAMPLAGSRAPALALVHSAAGRA